MRKFALLVLGLAMILLLAACGQKTVGEDGVVPVAVRVMQAERGDIVEAFSFSGEVAAGGDVQVIPRVAGKIERVSVKPGDSVKIGDLLVQLAAKELALAVRQAEAALEMAKANDNSARTGSGLAQLQANVRQLEINYNLVWDQLQTMEALFGEGGLSLQQLNEVRARVEIAKSQYNLGKSQLEAHQRGEGQLEILAAQVKQAEVGLEMARLNYKNAVITAPVAGTVSLVNAEPGNFASPGMPVITLITGAAKQVVARLTEQSVLKVSVGMNVNIEVPVLDRIFVGEIKEVSPAVATGTKFYIVKVELSKDANVMPGMFARLQLTQNEATNVVLLPRTAILENEGRHYAFILKDGKAVRRDLVLGLTDETFAEIKAGITAGDVVVIAGQHFLRDGVLVQIEEDNAL